MFLPLIITGLSKINGTKLWELGLNFPKLADWLCMGWPSCLAALGREFSNRGTFLLHDPVKATKLTYLCCTKWTRLLRAKYIELPRRWSSFLVRVSAQFFPSAAIILCLRGRTAKAAARIIIICKGASIYEVRSGWGEGVTKKQTRRTKSAD